MNGTIGYTLPHDHPRVPWYPGEHFGIDCTGLYRPVPPLIKVYRFRHTCHKIPMYRIPIDPPDHNNYVLKALSVQSSLKCVISTRI